MAMKNIGVLLSPIPRKMDAMILYAVMNGIPIKHMVRYEAVPSMAFSGVDIAETTGSSSRSKSAVIAIETAMNNGW